MKKQLKENKKQLQKLTQKKTTPGSKTGANTKTNNKQRTKRLSKVMKARRNSQSTSVPVVHPEQIHVDEATGRRYSVDMNTGKSAWLDEEGEGSASSTNKPEKSAVSKRQSFKQFNGETGTYYQNVETGVTVWEVPKGGEIVEM